MATFLIIDTALDVATVALIKDNIITEQETNNLPQTYSNWIHVAIKNILNRNNIAFKNLDAISVTEGPGSYTGLRIGTSAAKGLAYALQKPLIAINTLALIALANKKKDVDLYIPMIDARRDEVFVGIFDEQINLIGNTYAHHVTKNSFEKELKNKKIVFCGNGAFKFKEFSFSPNAYFEDRKYLANELLQLTINKFEKSNFVDVGYFEPNYTKEFYFQHK